MKEEKSECCGADSITEWNHYEGTYSICSKCGKPFTPKNKIEGEPEKEEVMEDCQVCGNYICKCPIKPFTSLPSNWSDERKNIRTQLQYSLMGNYTENEWEVIINNVQSIIAKTLLDEREKLIGFIESEKRTDNEFHFALDKGFNSALETIIEFLRK